MMERETPSSSAVQVTAEMVLPAAKKNRRNTGTRKATIKDVALEASVSAMTVSRVVNGKGNVKQATVDKIQQAIAKVDYRPNIGARRLSGGQTYQLLMIFNNPNVTWTAEVLIGMMHACHNIGYHLSIEGVGDYEGESGAPIDYNEIAKLIDLSRIDGVILPPPICFDSQLLDIIRAGTSEIAEPPSESPELVPENPEGAHEVRADPPSLFESIRGINDFLARILDAVGANDDQGQATRLDLSLKLRIVHSTFVTLSEARAKEEAPLPELVPETLEAMAEQEEAPPVDQIA